MLSALLWLGLQLPDQVTISVEHFRSGHPGAGFRLAVALTPLLLSFVFLLLPDTLQRRWSHRALLATALLQLSAAWEVSQGFLDPDEPGHFHWVWQLSQGQLPYKDFFVVRHLLWHGLCAPLMWFFPDSLDIIFVFKFLMLLVLVLTVTTACLVARRVGANPWALLILLLSANHFVSGSVQFRSDPAAHLMLLLALLAFSYRRPGLAGLCTGLSFLMIQKTLAPAVGIFTGVVLARVRWPFVPTGITGWGDEGPPSPREGGGGPAGVLALGPPEGGNGWGWGDEAPDARGLARFTLAGVAVYLLYLLWVGWLGVFSDYVSCCFFSASIIARHFQAQPLWHSNATFMFWEGLRASPIVMLGTMAGTLWMLLGSRPVHRIIALAGLAAATSVFLTRLAYDHYTIMATGIPLIGAAYLITKLPTSSSFPLVNRVPQILLLWIASVSLFRWAACPPPGLDSAAMQLSLANIPAGAPFHGEGNRGNLCNPVFRPDATYYGIGSEEMSKWSRELGVVLPHGDPYDLNLLLPNPPEVLVIPSPGREQEALRFLAEHGIDYRRLSPQAWVRSR